MEIYTEVAKNIADISSTSAEVYAAVEDRASSDICAPKDFTTAQKITYLHLGTMGQDLFYSDYTKIRVPEILSYNPDTKAAYVMGAKATYQTAIMKKAKEIVYEIADQFDKDTIAKIDFANKNLTETEVMAVLYLAQLQGFHIQDWDKLDHSYCDVHSDWVCSFAQGKKRSHQQYMEETLEACVSVKLISQERYNKMPLTDKEVLSSIQDSLTL